MIKKRGLASYILLSIITSGIYGYWRIHVLARDMNIMCQGDGKKTRGFLAYFFFGILTLGIYNLVWIYMVGDRLHDNAKRYGLSFREAGGTVLLWFTLGAFILVGPLIALHIIFKNTNALADEYNKTTDDVSFQPPAPARIERAQAVRNRDLYTATTKTPVKAIPDPRAETVMVLNSGDTVYLQRTGENPKWFYAKTAEGNEGWCFAGHFKKSGETGSWNSGTEQTGEFCTAMTNTLIKEIPDPHSVTVKRLNTWDAVYLQRMGDNPKWFYAKTAEGLEGWCFTAHFKKG